MGTTVIEDITKGKGKPAKAPEQKKKKSFRPNPMRAARDIADAAGDALDYLGSLRNTNKSGYVKGSSKGPKGYTK